jgi:hypothetical protein
LQPYIFQDELNRSGTIPIITYRAKDLWQRICGYRGRDIADNLGIDEALEGGGQGGGGNLMCPSSKRVLKE